ncbi:MAG: hypothetical protein ACXVZO_03770 [Gaiellaceae bacterium]
MARTVRRLPAHLRRPVEPQSWRRIVEDDLRLREENLCALLRRGVFALPRSPYLALFKSAGIELEDALAAVRSLGVEAALRQFDRAGVFVTLEEFKGARPIERPGLSLAAGARQFDNPLLSEGYSSGTGGSRGRVRRLRIDLDHRSRQTLYHALFVDAFDVGQRPHAIWRAAPPGLAALGTALDFAKLRRPPDRWFSPTRLSPGRGTMRDYAFTVYAIAASRRAGVPIPWPQYVPLSEAGRVARWLSDATAERGPALVSTTPSAAVRVCVAAAEAGLDLAGTLFRVGGEPLTPARAREVEALGCTAVSNFTMSEAGRVGMACARATAVDDLHVMTDKLALFQRDGANDAAAGRSQAFFVTTLLSSSPKLMLNVESDDYGVLVSRRCGCLLGEIGLDLHVHTVRSHEKLTSEGMSFNVSDLLELIEETLPRRFGGASADYQLVEQERDGLPTVEIAVSPRIGAIDEAELIAFVLATLSKGPPYRAMMAGLWRSAGTLRVRRCEPYATSAGKVLPLHVLDAE